MCVTTNMDLLVKYNPVLSDLDFFRSAALLLTTNTNKVDAIQFYLPSIT